MQSQRIARFHYADPETGIEFVWHGGEYIDVGTRWSVPGQPGIHGDDFHAYDVINVWDYEKGEPRIARTLEAFEDTVREYLAENAEPEFDGLSCERCGINPAASCECD